MNKDELRQRLMDKGINHDDMAADPVQQFEQWYAEIIDAEVHEPGAMSLATVDEDGQPWQRIVLLKLFDENGFVFFTNYESRKAGQICC